MARAFCRAMCTGTSAMGISAGKSSGVSWVMISKGISANLEEICADLEARDLRDRTRAISPLVPAADARLLDNSALTIDESVDTVLGWWVDGWPHVLVKN